MKVQKLRKKEGKYANTLARKQVTAIFLMEDMRRIFLPKFIEICTEKPCWCLSGYMAMNIASLHKWSLNLNNNTHTSLTSHSCESSFVLKHECEAKDVPSIVIQI